ncbi:hypothetical protein BT96DRAFT_241808 [Gymnopus androsaceus JB14]|uniref:Protein kinase domain-containing protein n=1 Tax=Gymnopus androsaceus JB14 TaxID=1447944 RepID=A0A6A4IN61_9AGAR|nr:hypothetical protein BT96DRAFT_241808 [Gymnopus androsaceus JB14]
MQTNIINNLDESGLNPDSSFFKQLRGLLCPDIEPINQSISFLPSPIPSASPTFDLQHVIDASKSLESERSSSPSPKVPETSVHPSQLYRHIYASSGKWDWMLGHNIVDENSTFLAAGAMCSTYYKKGKAAGRELKYICKSWKTNINWDGAFYSELALYKKQLKPLQGKCVPNVIGLFAAPGALNVAMEPPHSSFWIEASTDMPLSLKQRCVDAFAEIHSRGVFHGDVELRHMLIGGDARITIIDFQESSALEPNEKLFLRPATDADLRKEMRKVKVKLDYPGARDYEKEKRKRCLTRHKRNADQTRKVVLSRSYTPLLEMDTEDDILNPPVLDVQEWQDWNVAPSLPQIFVVPGQSLQQRIGAYEAFLASLKPPSRTPGDPVPAPFHYRPNGDLQQAEIRKRRLVLTDFEHRPEQQEHLDPGQSKFHPLSNGRKDERTNLILPLRNRRRCSSFPSPR